MMSNRGMAELYTIVVSIITVIVTAIFWWQAIEKGDVTFLLIAIFFALVAFVSIVWAVCFTFLADRED